MEPNNLNLPPERRQRLERLLDQAYEDYIDDLENLTDAATDEIETAYRRDPLSLKDTVRDYTDQASQLANDYYDTVRQLWQEEAGVEFTDFDHTDLIDSDRVLWQQQGGYSNTDYNGLTYTQVKNGQARSGATIDDLWPALDTVDDWQQFIADMISTSTRLTQQRNMRADPTKPRWARVPRGKTCAFCTMLASRGFAYLSEDTAGRQMQYHADCDCQIIPNWGKQALAGYDPDKLYGMWKEGVDAAGDGDWREALRQMRRLHPEQLKDGVHETSGPWPKDVIYPYAGVWEHVFDGHGPGTRIEGKTHFPDDWSAEKVRWAVMEAVAAPDYVKTAGANRENRYKMVDDVLIRVWLQKKRGNDQRFRIHTGHPTTQQEREMLWPLISRQLKPTDG